MSRDNELFESPTVAEPFLKWAGGKGQMLAQLEPLFPKAFKRYVEPFLGGGAVFFRQASIYPGLQAILSDSNTELINCYEVVRDWPDELMAALDRHAANFAKQGATHYYSVRTKRIVPNPVEQAARMIFLNKTCFNGLWRVNSRGEFNVPIGSGLPKQFYVERTIVAASRALRRATLKARDFEQTLKETTEGDFVYVDPPYFPLSPTSNFTGYTAEAFGRTAQAKLAVSTAEAVLRGATVVLSNSDTPLVRELYGDFGIYEVTSRRSINAVGTGRGRVGELLIIAKQKPKRIKKE